MTLSFSLKNLLPLLAIILGIASIVAPRFLNVFVAIFLIAFGLYRLGLDPLRSGRFTPSAAVKSRRPKMLTARPSTMTAPPMASIGMHDLAEKERRAEDAGDGHQQGEGRHGGGRDGATADQAQIAKAKIVVG